MNIEMHPKMARITIQNKFFQIKQTMQNSSEALYKLLVVGDSGTGKTSIVRRGVHGLYVQGTRPTVGVDFAIKSCVWKEHTVTLQLWDIAGMERFRNMTRTFYQNAAGACIVVDTSNKATLKAAELWKQDIDAKVFVPGTNKPLPCLLVINKCDLGEGECGSNAELDDFCQRNKMCGWIKTSAQDGTGVNELFDKVIGYMHEAQKSTGPADNGASGGGGQQNAAQGKIKLGGDSSAAKPADKKDCAC